MIIKRFINGNHLYYIAFSYSQAMQVTILMNKKESSIKKDKKILLRVSDNLDKAIQKAIQLGIADNAAEFVRRSVVNHLLDLKLLGTEENE